MSNIPTVTIHHKGGCGFRDCNCPRTITSAGETWTAATMGDASARKDEEEVADSVSPSPPSSPTTQQPVGLPQTLADCKTAEEYNALLDRRIAPKSAQPVGLSSKPPKYLDGQPLEFRMEETTKKDERGHYISITVNGSELMKGWNPDKKRKAIFEYVFACLTRGLPEREVSAVEQDNHYHAGYQDGLKAAANWQPIVTAPKDGTHVDLFTRLGNRYADCLWFPAEQGWRQWSQSGYIIEPTHWMLIPENQRRGTDNE